LHLALAELPVSFFPGSAWSVGKDCQTVTALRSVLMKPEHLDWIDRIWEIVQGAVAKSASAVSKPN
jgi:tyrosine decarboxylase / aspartate 1-decarboxylase